MGTEINCTYKCSGCRFYKAYYSKGASAFYREKAGYCERKGTAVNAKGYCVLYKNRPKGEKGSVGGAFGRSDRLDGRTQTYLFGLGFLIAGCVKHLTGLKSDAIMLKNKNDSLGRGGIPHRQ